MATSEENCIHDIVDDFIHSSIWLLPIQTFIHTNCACFDYDDDDNSSSLCSLTEQKNIYKQYENLANSLIASLSEDLKLDIDQVEDFYQRNNSATIDESYEQLYSISDFYLFTEMMKRKNLILQSQALTNLQLECGILKPTDTNDDRVLQLLLKATSSTSSSSGKASVDNASKASSHVKQNDKIEMTTNRNKQRQSKETKSNTEPSTIASIPEEILREKLRELTISTPSSINDPTASAISSREHFLKQQRDLIIKQQHNQRIQELEKESSHVRPQSAASVARKAIETTTKQEQHISNDELEKRQAMAAKIRRAVVNKR
ncbi:unnamed protein product [Rotaria magnacalcarata]|uniref:Cilia- and flagella-associated protein 36 n=1 Tax=Rotaria magnacalcarata TaxID=392030 RepID=A0A816YY05_9BILA|nr:unnamed protein product [Rotaria magnacalcarata]CAF1637114.1 unnamed protein product [Rotaria magnacalcarata]CAF2132068.1 unnamed protein product [Rotaria magnacalcarata]CAF2180223.1 unnamed protein product [Rotaria magnacalcarata]CAF3938913.1 unnamed protein product [Rotaria magnacalcarata]